MKKIISIALAIAFPITMAFSQQITQTEKDTHSNSSAKEIKHAINSCPFAPIFGIFSVSYEYLILPNHGLVGRFDYEAVPSRFEDGGIPENYPDAVIEASGLGFILNYRWHFSGEMESVFIGVYTRYRHFSGTGMVESTEFEFTVPEITAGLNIGKRWVWNCGLNMTVAFGYGFSKDTWESNPTNSSIEAVLKSFENSYDFFDPFYGEFSFGYAF